MIIPSIRFGGSCHQQIYLEFSFTLSPPSTGCVLKALVRAGGPDQRFRGLRAAYSKLWSGPEALTRGFEA